MSQPQVFDCLIVGGGPAGLSAAIYAARFNRSTLVLDRGEGRWDTRETNENYLGFPEGIRSRKLRELGRRQAARFGAEFVEAEVTTVERLEACFRATTAAGDFTGRTLILATGVVDILPDFASAEDCLGKSLFWCITCDGYKARGKQVVVVGPNDDAATTCLQFLNFTDRLTFVTNRPRGESRLSSGRRRALGAAGIPVNEGTIADVGAEDGVMSEVILEDGSRIPVEMMFSQEGATPNADLARQLGITVNEQGYVEVDENQHTNVEGVYAAGDLTRQFAHQIVTAAHEGSMAAQAANQYLYRPEQRA